ncbi:hypothetical protein [Microbacterium karelineae]|uniref:hypothetical protein n=1 Tax=Microbacterium karelineae TaxID=2654283 RepID=UPI0012EA1ADA|nr:hypothetical protein [Microbacterium karelineae]
MPQYRLDLATEWADEHMRRLMRSPKRKRQVARERFTPTPEHLEAQAYDEKTEHLRRLIRYHAEQEEAA